MKRRVWLSAVVVMALAVAFLGWLPGFRLEREIAAARKEGLWTEAADVRRAIGAVPPEENAASLVREAIALKNRRPVDQTTNEALGRLFKGTASVEDRRRVRAYCAANADLAALLRRAAARPRLSFDRPWEQGEAVLLPEYALMRPAARLLAASASLGIMPQENLRAAARLSALTAQEPTDIAAWVSVSTGKIALKEAQREGRGREIEALLGPSIDARRIANLQFQRTLQTMRLIGGDEREREVIYGKRDEGLWPRLRRTGPWRDGAMRQAVARYREFWREMPKEGSDYASAVRAYERRMPAVEAALDGYDGIFSALRPDPGNADAASSAREFQKYAEARRAARSGR